MSLPTEEQVKEKLTAVIDPELRRNIVELGMVRSVEIKDDGQINVTVSLTTPGCPIRSHFQEAVVQQVSSLDGVTGVGVGFDVLSDEEKSGLRETLGRGKLPEGALAQVKNVICVASGKGGVGKSTMTANLAAALQAEGKKAGALDCDVYGYSIPRMLGVDQKPEVNSDRKILPPVAESGVKTMSIGYFVEQNSAVVWRGPMLHKAIQQFLEDVAWGELDYLLLDLPPGTGDIAMTLAQLLPQAKITIVTTPQPAAQSVARRSAEMAAKVDLEVMGIIENMAGFTTPEGETFSIFGEGGGQLLADELEVPLFGSVPLSEELREHADVGNPLSVDQPDSPAGQAIVEIARKIIATSPIELPMIETIQTTAPEIAPKMGKNARELPLVQ
ncbi:MAG TPA: Mrp/NBP35 family ATP-binding protein [Solirubrobacterales bacterium]|nr:Mrp/NBP35 family ATP-binding protein [Solirubrobacterales bacterium]HMU27117.1 Mrp/NBP35 family ATP-binding protein [Solirubrobacterales bacterium]HMW44520.1 Mrp/NBP35 family ATP-binding protein [Solirubrobacterales bacterium]HMX72209.1 Mrp/NBP35 family ATP-binding protein [Solirubrobacterales bacterium]HNA24833.1 Mrp/NBP35 family ATP-binding protein [Solirubrobacterales bacterium]